MAIIPQPNSIAIAIADEYYKSLKPVRMDLPEEVPGELGYDFTRFVRCSVAEVKETLMIAFGLVALMIFLFLRDWRSTIIPLIATPVSIISGFFIMYVQDSIPKTSSAFSILGGMRMGEANVATKIIEFF